MTPGWYIITQTSAKDFRLKGYAEALARTAFEEAKPKKGCVVQLVRFTTHYSWHVVEEKRQ